MLWVCLSCSQCSCQNYRPPSGLTEHLIRHRGTPHSTASNQGTHFAARGVRHGHEIHWFYHVPHHPEAVGLIERQKGLLETPLHCQVSSSSLESWARILQMEVYVLNPRYSTVSPTVRSKCQGVENGIVPLTINPSDPLGKCLLLVPMTLNSAGLGILVSERGTFLPRATTNIPLIWKLRRPLGLFELLMPLNQQVKKGVTVSGGVTDSD